MINTLFLTIVAVDFIYRALSAPHSARFGAGSGQIWLDDVRCSGSESLIVNCQHGGWGVENCDHSEDASVICRSAPRPTAEWENECDA